MGGGDRRGQSAALSVRRLPSSPLPTRLPGPSTQGEATGGREWGGRSWDTRGSTHTLGCLPCGLSAEPLESALRSLKWGWAAVPWGFLRVGASPPSPALGFSFAWKLSAAVSLGRGGQGEPPSHRSWALSRRPPPRQKPLFQSSVRGGGRPAVPDPCVSPRLFRHLLAACLPPL